MTSALDALLTLRTHLLTITQANGYASTIQSVRTGRDALVTGSQADLPLLSLVTLADEPADGNEIEGGLGGAVQQWRRTVEMEGFIAVDDQWETALDALVDDIRRALVAYPSPLRIGRIAYTPPADNGGSVASFLMPLSFPYVLSYPISY